MIFVTIGMAENSKSIGDRKKINKEILLKVRPNFTLEAMTKCRKCDISDINSFTEHFIFSILLQHHISKLSKIFPLQFS